MLIFSYSHLCIIIDKSGLIVFHPDFTDASKSQNIEGQHIMGKVSSFRLCDQFFLVGESR